MMSISKMKLNISTWMSEASCTGSREVRRIEQIGSGCINILSCRTCSACFFSGFRVSCKQSGEIPVMGGGGGDDKECVNWEIIF